ncbi:MAG: hypothetical protein ABWZ76_05280 [Acidimicrobiales bacterium]
MRVQRLVIEAGDTTFTLDLHPRLTVVAGMGPVERASLIGELIGALGGSRPGVHVELEEHSGRHLAVFRPTTGRHRVVDVDQAQDVTDDLADDRGRCDVLDRLGLDATTARRTMRFGSEDLVTNTARGRSVEVLAAHDQQRLWAAATALHEAEDELSAEAEASGTVPEDASLFDRIDARHAAAEEAARRLDASRRRTFLIGGASGLLAAPAVALAGAVGLSLLAIAALALLASLDVRRRHGQAVEAEAQVLTEVGASSYLAFQLQRVNGLLGDDDSRRTLMHAAGGRRDALVEWQRLAGDIAVEWALDHQEEIQAASRLRREVDALGALSVTAPDVSSDQTDELAHTLVTRLVEARSAGTEEVPLLLDDPFRQLDPSMKLLLLELLGRAAGEPQVVFLTDDEDVASWARLEALTGDVSLVEPKPEPVSGAGLRQPVIAPR